MKAAIMTILAGGALAGCSVFPDYVRPAVDTPAQWQVRRTEADGAAERLDWWRQFNDPVLTRLLQAAEQDNPTLDQAVASIASARPSLAGAEAGGMPGLTANGAFSRSKGGTSNGINGQTSGSIGTGFNSGITQLLSGSLDASWELDLFGKFAFGRQAEQARLDAAELALHNAKVSLAAEVASDYVSYRACQLTAAAYQNAIDSKQDTARLTGVLAGAGFSSPADAVLAEASLHASESSLIAQRVECDNTVKALVALTGLAETELRAWLDRGSGIPVPTQFRVDSVPADLLTQRPDLAADERKLAAASADIGNAVAKRYPSVSLTGSIGKRKTETTGLTLSSNTWSIGPTVTLPIFDGGELRSKVDSAEAAYAGALATYRSDIRAAVKEVEQALVNLSGAEQRESVEARSAEQYRRYFLASEQNWRAGGLSLLSLEDARGQMIAQEISLITQQQNRVQYWIALYKALGGGWRAQDTQLSVGDARHEEQL
ncbi:efflux transporter outer membrane subunit [Methylomonas sp. EFPC3]|uniref:efflux transporter outer membrane subunit n=1 Tax=Methylomonas sp. EFPC3 TaxID=3021710 RepID=UPI002416D641|nr:efflux transporter outer membrane subunit [Methylomonas sp. EFPC3]WFP51573.1 efflux transporter outer membrane subunit [Methylomonas sp. EFPC3]